MEGGHSLRARQSYTFELAPFVYINSDSILHLCCRDIFAENLGILCKSQTARKVLVSEKVCGGGERWKALLRYSEIRRGWQGIMDKGGLGQRVSETVTWGGSRKHYL